MDTTPYLHLYMLKKKLILYYFILLKIKIKMGG